MTSIIDEWKKIKNNTEKQYRHAVKTTWWTWTCCWSTQCICHSKMCFWQACESPTCFSSSFRRCPLIPYWWQNKVYHTLFHSSTVLTLWPATPADPCSPVFPGSPYEWKKTCFELETEQKINSLTWHCILMQSSESLQPYIEAFGAWHSHDSCGSSVSNRPCRAWTTIFTWGTLSKGKPHFDSVIFL